MKDPICPKLHKTGKKAPPIWSIDSSSVAGGRAHQKHQPQTFCQETRTPEKDRTAVKIDKVVLIMVHAYNRISSSGQFLGHRRLELGSAVVTCHGKDITQRLCVCVCAYKTVRLLTFQKMLLFCCSPRYFASTCVVQIYLYVYMCMYGTCCICV